MVSLVCDNCNLGGVLYVAWFLNRFGLVPVLIPFDVVLRLAQKVGYSGKNSMWVFWIFVVVIIKRLINSFLAGLLVVLIRGSTMAEMAMYRQPVAVPTTSSVQFHCKSLDSSSKFFSFCCCPRFCNMFYYLLVNVGADRLSSKGFWMAISWQFWSDWKQVLSLDKHR